MGLRDSGTWRLRPKRIRVTLPSRGPSTRRKGAGEVNFGKAAVDGGTSRNRALVGTLLRFRLNLNAGVWGLSGSFVTEYRGGRRLKLCWGNPAQLGAAKLSEFQRESTTETYFEREFPRFYDF